jgi:lipoyl(octanoyl) transferase
MKLDTQPLQVIDLGRMAYREAWARQQDAHDAVLAGGPPTLFLVEHPPVITFGRRGVTPQHLLASAPRLEQMGVEVVESDRGGDVTFHGPGQIVAYPIIRLNDHRYSVGGYVHALEQRVIDTLQQFDIRAHTDRAAVGVWTDQNNRPEKICAIGVRVKRGVTMHGIALNVETNLACFDLIVPCGISERGVTSMRKVLGDACPYIETVRTALAAKLTTL